MLRWFGPIQWPTIPGPIMSARNSNFLPFQTNTMGQELPRRSISAISSRFPAGISQFILQDAGGPEQANHVGFALGAEAGDDIGGPLAQIAGSAGNFPFLLQRAGGEFNFRADAGFVVVLAFESEVGASCA